MKIINAPQEYLINNKEIACFLAGGMGHTEWQKECIEELNKHELNNLVIFNPFNSNIENLEGQITWEFNYLNFNNQNFIFSIYFDKYTDQPISMYELGRASVTCNKVVVDGYTIQHGFYTVVSFHSNAKNKQELIYQCKLANIPCKVRTPKEHAEEIINKYKIIIQKLKEEHLCQ